MSESRKRAKLPMIEETGNMERIDYSAHGAHKGKQVVTGFAFRLESAAMATAAIGFAAWHYAGLIRAAIALFN